MDPFRLFRSSTQMLMVDVQERLLPAISGHEDIRRNIVKLIIGLALLSHVLIHSAVS